MLRSTTWLLTLLAFSACHSVAMPDGSLRITAATFEPAAAPSAQTQDPRLGNSVVPTDLSATEISGRSLPQRDPYPTDAQIPRHSQWRYRGALSFRFEDIDSTERGSGVSNDLESTGWFSSLVFGAQPPDWILEPGVRVKLQWTDFENRTDNSGADIKSTSIAANLRLWMNQDEVLRPWLEGELGIGFIDDRRTSGGQVIRSSSDTAPIYSVGIGVSNFFNHWASLEVGMRYQWFDYSIAGQDLDNESFGIEGGLAFHF